MALPASNVAVGSVINLDFPILYILYGNKELLLLQARVAELGSLSSGAKMAMKILVKRVFTIFASNASFLRVIANLQN